MTLALLATDNATRTDSEQQSALALPRRITEHDPDYLRLHARTVRRLTASIAQFVRDLRSGDQAAQSRFIHRHTQLLRDAYLAAHEEGQRDYWQAVSLKRPPIADADAATTRQRLAYFAVGSAIKMAREGQNAAGQRFTGHITQADGLLAQISTTDTQEAILLATGDTDPLSQWQGSLDQRVNLQASIAWSGIQDGYLLGGRMDPAQPYSLVWWVLGYVKGDHCFPAGTLIDTPTGQTPIEAIQVGDLVQTLHGPRKVTRLYANPFVGRLTSVTAGGRYVACTPNHPFLTQRGWVTAGELLSSDQVVLAQEGGHYIAAHVALPNAGHGEAAGPQVGVVRAVAPLLGKLARRQRLEARVAVPVVAVGLNDERADTHIHDELVLDDGRRLEVNAQLGEDGTQADLKFAGPLTFEQSMASSERGMHLRSRLGMLTAPRFHLGHGLGALHRIARQHIRFGRVVDESARGSLGQGDVQVIRLVPHLAHGEAERSRNNISAFRRVMLAQVGDTLRCPGAGDGWTNARQLRTKSAATCRTAAMTAQRRGAVACVAALRAMLDAVASALGLTPSQVAIATGHAAETTHAHAAPRLLELPSALFTSELHHYSVLPLTTSIPDTRTVYNLEVEGEHHYIANGFVVHNCDDCKRLASESPYNGVGVGGNELEQTPGDGRTACGANCKCALSYVPASVIEEGRIAGAVQQAQDWLDYQAQLKAQSLVPEGFTAQPSGASNGLPTFQPLWKQPGYGGPQGALLVPPNTTDLATAQKAALDAIRSAQAEWERVRADHPDLPADPWYFSDNPNDPYAVPTIVASGTYEYAEEYAALRRLWDAQGLWLAANGVEPSDLNAPDDGGNQ